MILLLRIKFSDAWFKHRIAAITCLVLPWCPLEIVSYLEFTTLMGFEAIKRLRKRQLIVMITSIYL